MPEGTEPRARRWAQISSPALADGSGIVRRGRRANIRRGYVSVPPIGALAVARSRMNAGPARSVNALSGPGLDGFVADRTPAKDQIPFLRATPGLTFRVIMGEEVRGAVGNGVIHPHMALKPLVQVPSLRNVDRNPHPVLGLPGINVITWQRTESSVERINLVLVTLPGLARPRNGRRSLASLFPATT